jgi:hypothetical protein
MALRRPDEDPESLVARVRRICTAFPGVTERPSHGAPTWFIRDSRTFVTIWAYGHHENEFPHLWCAAPPGAQGELIASAPTRYHYPPYVGHRGWIGVRLDVPIDWTELAEVIEDAYRTVAPKRLIAELDAAELDAAELDAAESDAAKFDASDG